MDGLDPSTTPIALWEVTVNKVCHMIIVLAAGLGTIQAAKNATKTIPIVMTGGGLDPVEAGFIDSLARPGGNVTGITNFPEG
jgi:ABC-type uncharacterized transport system substrate-binding protein